MIVGFTGTRNGMTQRQKAAVRKILRRAELAHHGDCVGADEEFHQLCIEADVPVVIHPPNNDRLRARCQGAIRVARKKDYIARNHDIVDECELLIGAPKEASEPLPARGQGTWSTIRYGRNNGVEVKVVWP